jgi:hypothetical protein
MSRNLLRLLALCAVSLVTGCAVIVTPPPQTTVEAENHLTSMSVDVSGTTTTVDGIDLENVAIGGDVSYSSIPYGTTSSEKITNSYGKVDVDIGTAVVWTKVLNQPVSVSFSNISPMSTTITRDVVNTVVFDQTTAGVIFSALAKKTAK